MELKKKHSELFPRKIERGGKSPKKLLTFAIWRKYNILKQWKK